jgi:hypothetical protein
MTKSFPQGVSCYLCWRKTVVLARNTRWVLPMCMFCLKYHDLLKEYPFEAQMATPDDVVTLSHDGKEVAADPSLDPFDQRVNKGSMFHI